MAKLSEESELNDSRKEKLQQQHQQEQYHQLQRELADAITRLASLDDIRILLAGGARVDGPVTQGLHPIHYAAYQNFVPAARVSSFQVNLGKKFFGKLINFCSYSFCVDVISMLW